MSRFGFNSAYLWACAVAMVSTVCLSSCGNASSGAGADGCHVGKTIYRMDRDMAVYAGSDSASRDSLMRCYDKPLRFLFALTGRGEVTDDALCAYSSSRGVRMFTAAVDSLLPELDSVQSVLGVAEDRMGKLLPKACFGDVYAVVSPYNQSIFTTDSMMLVGLNHYLGAGFDGYSSFEPYQRLNKRIGQLPYDMVEAAVASAYPMTVGAHSTVLDHLLYQGALIEAKMQILPGATEADALGYTPEQMAWLEANEVPAWEALVTRKLLYSPSVSDAERLILPSPVTTILHPESPGRAGRYIGHRIVRAYLDANPRTALDHLLSPEFYSNPQTLLNARYAPGQ